LFRRPDVELFTRRLITGLFQALELHCKLRRHSDELRDIERSFEEGIRTYDFGTDWPYLRRWPHGSKTLNELMVFRKSFGATVFRHWHLNVRPMMARFGAGAPAPQGRGA
jgi:hypothetical protein